MAKAILSNANEQVELEAESLVCIGISVVNDEHSEVSVVAVGKARSNGDMLAAIDAIASSLYMDGVRSGHDPHKLEFILMYAVQKGIDNALKKLEGENNADSYH